MWVPRQLRPNQKVVIANLCPREGPNKLMEAQLLPLIPKICKNSSLNFNAVRQNEEAVHTTLLPLEYFTFTHEFSF